MEGIENVYASIYFVSKHRVKMIFLDVSELGHLGGPGRTVANETSEIVKVTSSGQTYYYCGRRTGEA